MDNPWWTIFSIRPIVVEVIRLTVNLLFEPDGDVLTEKGIVKTMLDPACGTGGMLSVSEDYLKELNPDARLEVFGEDYNAESFAICCSDMTIKGQMELYLRWLDRHDRQQGEDSPLGLILCAGKSAEHVKLLRLEASRIRVAEYLTELPPKEVLQRKLRQAVEAARSRLGEGRERPKLKGGRQWKAVGTSCRWTPSTALPWCWSLPRRT